MSNYSYVAIDVRGIETRGSIDVPSQGEALKRIKDMGLFPTKILETREVLRPVRRRRLAHRNRGLPIPWLFRKVRTKPLTLFTRQLATLLEAGMPLLRSLRTLQEQAEDRRVQSTIGDLALAIEEGSSFAEALELQSHTFNRLYINMVKAGELSGSVEISLRRLAEFMEKSQRIKGKVKAAMFYPGAVITVAIGVVALLMVFVVPRFKEIFESISNGAALPAFTRFVLAISDLVKDNAGMVGVAVLAVAGGWFLALQTDGGRSAFD